MGPSWLLWFLWLVYPIEGLCWHFLIISYNHCVTPIHEGIMHTPLEGVECFCVHSWECSHPVMAHGPVLSLQSSLTRWMSAPHPHRSSILLLHILWGWLVKQWKTPAMWFYIFNCIDSKDKSLSLWDQCVCVCVHMDTHTCMYIHIGLSRWC